MRIVIPERAYRRKTLPQKRIDFKPGASLCVFDYFCGVGYSSPRVGKPMNVIVSPGRPDRLCVENVCSIVKTQISLEDLEFSTSLVPLGEIKNRKENPLERRYYLPMFGQIFVGDGDRIKRYLEKHWPEYSLD